MLATDDERNQYPELESTSEQVQQEIADRLEQTLGWLSDDEPAPDEFPAGDAVPTRLVERDAPGISGTALLGPGAHGRGDAREGPESCGTTRCA